MRTSIVCVVMVLGSGGLGGCAADDASTGAAGPPEILQVLVRERVAIVDDDGHPAVELRARLAFGDHPDIDPADDDRQVQAAVARDDQRLRVVVDELLRGNALEEVLCADGSWSRVPVGSDFDDVARCAGADLSRCAGICIGAAGPIGIRDDNGDGAFDDTRLIEGAVTVTCDGVAVPLDPQRSYYQPSGDQRVSAGSLGTDALGPAVVLAPAAGLRPGASCGLAFAAEVVDKQGTRPCAAGPGGCTPGDTAAVAFTVEPFTLAWSEPADGATDVPLTSHDGADAVITLRLNATLDPATVPAAIAITADGSATEGLTPIMAADDDATVQITVPGGFRAGTTYRVTVAGGGGGLKDAYADALAADTTITWTTADATDDATAAAPGGR